MKNRKSNLLVTASIGYLGIHALAALLSSLLGGFLVLTAIATLGFLFPFAVIDWYTGAGFGGDSHVGTVWTAAVICGAICALCTICGMVKPKGRR